MALTPAAMLEVIGKFAVPLAQELDELAEPACPVDDQRFINACVKARQLVATCADAAGRVSKNAIQLAVYWVKHGAEGGMVFARSPESAIRDFMTTIDTSIGYCRTVQVTTFLLTLGVLEADTIGTYRILPASNGSWGVHILYE